MPSKAIKHNYNLLILTGFSCNNNCIICSIKDMRGNYPDRSTEDIFNDLGAGKDNGYNEVEFTGGEPTARRDIITLVARAKDLGYKKVALSTNGRLFSYPEFCRDIIGAGLNKITFSLLGPTKKIHDAITRTPGSFKQITGGIKNAREVGGVHINISSVISRLNYTNLAGFGEFIADLGVKNWYLLDLIPDGNAKKFYKKLVVRLKELYNELNGVISLKDRFDEFGFFDFPFCLFKEELRNTPNVRFVNSKMRAETSRQVGYDPERISKSDDGKYSDAYRANIEVCKKCKYYKECGGIWRPYLDLFDEKEVVDLLTKNNCLDE